MADSMSVKSRSTTRSTKSAATASLQPRPPREPPSGGLFSTAIGRVIDVLDVDGVIQRIDVNDVVSRVNFNDVIDGIDFDNLMDQIDVDALIDRIDVNRVVERVDVNALIERSNLKQIIARSTSGMCSVLLNSFRALCIKVDQSLQHAGRCACCGCVPQNRHWTLPPLPSVPPIFYRSKRKQDLAFRRSLKCPKKSTLLATAVQGRNAGTFSRFLAYSVDKGLTIGFTFLLILVAAALYDLLPKESNGDEVQADLAEVVADGVVTNEELAQQLAVEEGVEKDERFWWAVGAPLIASNVFAFLFDAVSMAAVGRTIGKGIMGLTVVNSRNGNVGHITMCQAICRSFLSNLVFGLKMVGVFVALAREDRRSIIDLLCGTTVIYAWDAKSYRLASEELAKDMPFGDLDLELVDSESEDEMATGDAPAVGSPTMVSRQRPSEPRNRSQVKTRVVRIPIAEDGRHGSWQQV